MCDIDMEQCDIDIEQYDIDIEQYDVDIEYRNAKLILRRIVSKKKRMRKLTIRIIFTILLILHTLLQSRVFYTVVRALGRYRLSLWLEMT